MQHSRRKFFRYSFFGLKAFAVVMAGSRFASNSLAAAASADDKPMDYKLIKQPKRDYISNLKDVKPQKAVVQKKLNNHKKVVAKVLGGSNPKNILPICQNCIHYKVAKNGYGKCTMVMALGKSDTDYVSKNGWCNIWTPKASELKKMA